MALVTSIFGGETLDRGTSTQPAGGGWGGWRNAEKSGDAPRGFLLSDQEYYDLYIRPKEAELLRGADATSGALARSSRARQGQFMQAQGLGGSVLGQQSGQTMDASFQRAVRRARQGSRMEAENLRRREFAERDRVRAQELQKVSQASQVEAALASLIPYAGPYISAATGAAGALWGMGLSDTPNQRSTSDNLDVLSFGDQYGEGEPSSSSRTRGGGGYDLYA